MQPFETHLLHTWIIGDKLVEASKIQPISISGVFEINFGFEQRVIYAYDTSLSEQIVVQDEVVVVDVIFLISINENYVKLLTSGSQFLERER